MVYKDTQEISEYKETQYVCICLWYLCMHHCPKGTIGQKGKTGARGPTGAQVLYKTLNVHTFTVIHHL